MTLTDAYAGCSCLHVHVACQIRNQPEGRPAAFKLSYRIARTLARRLTRLDEEVVEAIRELESRGETDVEAFRDRLITDWSV